MKNLLFIFLTTTLFSDVETIYLQYPLKQITWGLYLSSLVFVRYRKIFFFSGFTLHTLLLLARSFILDRPPVSSMFETLLFASWIVFLFPRPILIAAGTALFSLCFLMKDSLGPVQAVLNSPTWLTVHVLTVTASYGFFFVSSVLGHLFLWRKQEGVFRSMMHTTFLGLFFLIMGTLLGALWADQSWGRLWDWDPKETWAFISICAYLAILHLQQSKRAAPWMIALGSSVAFLFITFNWYGVNFILKEGLHSYGFSTGGDLFYFLFLIGDAALLTTLSFRKISSRRPTGD